MSGGRDSNQTYAPGPAQPLAANPAASKPATKNGRRADQRICARVFLVANVTQRKKHGSLCLVNWNLSLPGQSARGGFVYSRLLADLAVRVDSSRDCSRFDTADMKPRVGFVLEQALGHVAYGMSLRQALSKRGDIECEWLEVSFDDEGFGRVPLLGKSYALRGNVRARANCRRASEATA